MDIDVLHRMINPSTQKKNLRQSISILKRKGLIESLCLTQHLHFYFLSQAQKNRENVAELIGATASDVKQSLLRKRDWIHNQWCEYWIHSIKRIFPEAEIIRENNIIDHDKTKRILRLTSRDFELMPDFLLIFPATSTSEEVSIAFEIERTRKSDKRIMKKLKRYLNGTYLDGLIYICDSGRLVETISLLYKSKLLDNAERIKHYGNNFFLFSDAMTCGDLPLNSLFNTNRKSADFTEWCNYLRTTKRTLRRDLKFNP